MAILVKHNKVSTVPDDADTSLVRPSDWNADHTLTGFGTAAEKDAGVANGVATLDGTGKVPVSELPAAVLGALNYQGTWNASTNTPTLTSSVGTKGYYYVVNVAGTTNLDGITDWQVGDWAVFNGTVWEKVDNTDAGGDVVGPTSATDNAITRFDGTTGRVIQNSTVTLDDNGNIINANSLGLDTTPATVPTTVGTMSWDDGEGVPDILLKGGNVTLKTGTQEYARVYNDSGTTLTKGQAVYISGAQGNRVAVKLARADVEATSFGTLGLVAETIANGAEGFIIVSGALYKLDTLGLTAGAVVYLSPTTAGAITTTKPQAPDQLVVLGFVERVHATVGSIYVKVDNGYELDELHDVQITSPTSGNVLIYDATTTPTGVWKNANLTDGTGITITEGAGSVTIANAGVTQATAGTGISVSASTGNVTITNTAPDQTVSLTGGTGISTSGTYPSFTITNTAPDQTVAIASGTGISVTGTYPNFTVANTGVTSVTGTSPVVSSGGATPAISMPAATSSVNGYLTSTDWTTFNNKGTGSVTSVATGTGLTGGPITTTGTISLANTAVTPASYTYASITVDAQGRLTAASSGTAPVTSVTGTAPIASSGGTTPAISIPKATGSVDGYLSSTDWTTFNNKGSGTVTSVSALTLGTTGTDLSSTVANGTTTPVITLNVPTASATNRGALSSTDWTTFNNKANAFTYTTNYIPYGQGTTTPTQSANLTFDGTTQTAPIQRASNGIVVNSKTVSASYTIASGDSAMSAGPITVNSGVTVTVSSGSRWVVL